MGQQRSSLTASGGRSNGKETKVGIQLLFLSGWASIDVEVPPVLSEGWKLKRKWESWSRKKHAVRDIGEVSLRLPGLK
jgi:hypothetical protein